MAVIIHFDRRIDAQQHLDLLALAVRPTDHENDFLLRFDVIFEAQQIETLIAGDAQ